MFNRRHLLQSGLACSSLALPSWASAQAASPELAKIICGFPPGGTSDRHVTAHRRQAARSAMPPR